MRINKYVRDALGISRRKADEVIAQNRVRINESIARLGDSVIDTDKVYIDDKPTTLKANTTTVLLNKPVGYVCSKDGQGSQTVYDLLPEAYHSLAITGRLDKDSSGLVILTNDGKLHQKLEHPSNNKQKVYKTTVDKELSSEDVRQLLSGVDIGDKRPSKFKSIKKLQGKTYEVTLTEGRNRQIRRSLQSIGKNVVQLHRVKAGDFSITQIKNGKFCELT